jgi:UDP-N-acetyl-D-mannosaminuronic acid dehydrogenase
MVKLMENTYRDINIAVANEFSRLPGVSGLISGGHPDRQPPSQGEDIEPRSGVGGHCISVDPWFLVEAAPDLAELISAARHVNDAQPHFVVDHIKTIFGNDLHGRRVSALGLAFKPDVDDLRESPAIEVVKLLQEDGAIVHCHEPYVQDTAIPGVTMMPTLEDAIRDAELLVLLVGHKAFRDLDPGQVLPLTPARLVFDGVGGWDVQLWEKAGFTFYRLGVGE